MIRRRARDWLDLATASGRARLPAQDARLWALGTIATLASVAMVGVAAATHAMSFQATPAVVGLDLQVAAAALLSMVLILALQPGAGSIMGRSSLGAATAFAVSSIVLRLPDGPNVPAGRLAGAAIVASAAAAATWWLADARRLRQRSTEPAGVHLACAAIQVASVLMAIRCTVSLAYEDLRTVEWAVLGSIAAAAWLALAVFEGTRSPRRALILASLAALPATMVRVGLPADGPLRTVWAVVAVVQIGLAGALDRRAEIRAWWPSFRRALKRWAAPGWRVSTAIARRAGAAWLWLSLADRPAAPSSDSPRGDRLLLAMVALATLGSTGYLLGWALRAPWPLANDSAFVALRSLEVGTARTPWLGFPTSVKGSGTGTIVHSPGPLLFEFLAPFVRIFGLRVGGFVGATVICTTSWFVGTWAALRAGGRFAAIAAWVAGAVVIRFVMWGAVWEPFEGGVAYLPTLACLLTCWAVSSGVSRAVPPMVLLCSLCMQSYLPTGAPVLFVVIWSVGCLLTLRSRAPEPDRRRIGRGLRAGLVVGLACWVLPLVDVVTNRGGNLLLLARGMFDGSTPSAGADGVWQAARWLMSFPPGWNRFEVAFRADYQEYLVGRGWAGPVLVVIAVIVGRARGTDQIRRLQNITAVCAVSSVATMAAAPLGPAVGPRISWLGVVAALLWLTVVLTFASALGEWYGRRQTEARERRLAFAGSLACVLSVAAGLVLTQPRNLADVRGPFRGSYTSAPNLLPVAQAGLPDGVQVQIVSGGDAWTWASTSSLAAQLLGEGRDLTVDESFRGYFHDSVIVDRRRRGPKLVVSRALAPYPPPGRLLGTVEPPGWSSQDYRKVRDRVVHWVSSHGPLVVDTGSKDTVRALAGWIPDLSCEDLQAIEVGSRDVSRLPAGALVQMYANFQIQSPELPASLLRDVQEHAMHTPTALWYLNTDQAAAYTSPDEVAMTCAR